VASRRELLSLKPFPIWTSGLFSLTPLKTLGYLRAGGSLSRCSYSFKPEDQPVGGSLDAKIKKLQEFYWSDADPEGLGFVSLAEAYRRSGDPIEALRILRDGCKRHPGLASGHIVAGWIHAGEGDAAEAEGAFRAALEIDPQNVAALKGLAEVLSDGGAFEEALTLLQTLQPLDPGDGELEGRIHALRALPRSPDDEGDEAETEVPAVEEEPEPGPVWEDPEVAAEELDWEQAALQADNSQSEPGGHADPRSEEDVPGAEDASAAAKKKDDALVTRTMGDIFLNQGLLSEAERVFLELLERSPGDPELLERLGQVQAAQRGEWVAEAQRPTASALPGLIVPIEDLAPSTVVSIDDLAPDMILPIEALAPDPSPTRLDGNP
jgi:tetratricopeptide (TPR) repeat protein